MAETERKGLNRDQKIIIAGRIIRIVLRILVAIGIITICTVLLPYVSGEKEFEELPFTLSQLEAIFGLLLILYMWRKARI